MKILQTKIKGLETWLLLTDRGTLIATGLSEAAVRTKALKLGVQVKGGVR